MYNIYLAQKTLHLFLNLMALFWNNDASMFVTFLHLDTLFLYLYQVLNSMMRKVRPTTYKVMIKSFLLSFFTLLVCSINCFSQEGEDWEKMINDGIEAYQLGDYDKAIRYTKQASEVIARELGESDPAYSTVLNNLGAIYKKKGQLGAAELMYKKALTVIENSKSNDKLTYSEKEALEQAHQLSIHDLANLYNQMGRYQEANVLLQSIGLGSGENISTDDSEAGQLYYELNEYEKNNEFDYAVSKAQEIVALQKDSYGTSHPNYAKAISRLGIIYKKTGKFNEAETLFEQAQSIYLNKFGNTHPDYGTSLNNIASLYTIMGRYPEAEVAYQKTIAINKEVYGDAHIQYANSLNNLVTLYYKSGQKKAALPYAKEAYNITKNALGVNSEAYVNALSTLAGIYFAVGQVDKAEQMMRESLRINEEQFGKNNLKYAATLNNIANLYFKEGDYRKAESYYKESLNTYKEILGEKHLDYLTPLFQLAQVYFAEQKDDLAEPLYLEGIKKIHEKIKLYFPGLSDDGKTSFYRTIQKHFNEFNSFAIYRYEKNPNIVKEVYNNQLKTKAILLNASNKIRKHIFQSGDENLISLYKDLQTKRDRLVKAYNMNVDEQLSKGIDIDALEKEVKNLERDVSSKSEEFAKESKQSEYTWRNVQGNLKDKEAAIEIIRFEDIIDNSIKYSFVMITPKTTLRPEMIYICLLCTSPSPRDA